MVSRLSNGVIFGFVEDFDIRNEDFPVFTL